MVQLGYDIVGLARFVMLVLNLNTIPQFSCNKGDNID
jgi:hypothetical protein